VLVPTEDGALGLDIPRIPNEGKCETWQEVMTAIRTLLTETHGFRWAVIDTANQAEHLCAQFVCDRDFGGAWNPAPGKDGFSSYGKGEKAATQEFRALLSLLDQLQQKRGMGIILLSHVGLQKQGNALGADFLKFTGEMSKGGWALTCAWADQVGHACREMRAAKESKEARVAKASAIGVERWIVFEGGPGRDAGCRVGYEMPSRILLSWEEYERELKSDHLTALVDQALELIADAPEGARAKLMQRLGGEITTDKLREVGKQKLELTINWLLALQSRE
jgi:hypothetical protein